MAMELTREERDAVRSEILTVLTEVGDFTGYVDRGKVAKARELGERFNDCLALLDEATFATFVVDSEPAVGDVAPCIS